MKTKMFLLSFLALLLTGCGGCTVWNAQLEKIPLAEFESFEYHRGGNVTSADIVATGCELKDGALVIQELSIVENWGPALSLNVRLKGYKRALKPLTEQ